MWDQLPAVGTSLVQLVEDMAFKDKTRIPQADHAAFRFDPEDERWAQVHDAWRKIERMFWGPRLDLDRACVAIRTFLNELPRQSEKTS